jgi:hypothetical protein
MSTKKPPRKFESAAEAQHSLEEAAKQKEKYQQQLNTKFLAEQSELVEEMVKSVRSKQLPLSTPKPKSVGRGKKMSASAMIDRCVLLATQLSSDETGGVKAELAKLIDELLGAEKITEEEKGLLYKKYNL